VNFVHKKHLAERYQRTVIVHIFSTVFIFPRKQLKKFQTQKEYFIFSDLRI
jgi:hypothetical protein